MSQSPCEACELPADHPYLRGLEALNLMLSEGGSFSGYERNCCYLNTGGTGFANVSAVSGLDFLDDGRAIALVDWDHDGDLDMWTVNRTAPVVRFLRNELHGDNHFLALRLVGTRSSRDAIGARVTLQTAGPTSRKFSKTVYAGHGYLSQSSKWIHFGLGQAETIERLSIRWPNGEMEAIPPPAVDGRYQITEGSGKAVRHSSARDPVHLEPSEQQIPAGSETARIVVCQSVSLPEGATFRTFDGGVQSVAGQPEQQTLAILWASWCPNCADELAALAKSEDELSSAGLRILALNVDHLSPPSGSARDARQFLAQIDFPFEAGLATEALLAAMQTADSRILNRHRPLPLPASFLIDRDQRISVVYKGPINVSQLLDDIFLPDRKSGEFRDAAVPFAGTWGLPLREVVKPTFGMLVRALFSEPRNYLLMALIPVLLCVAVKCRAWKRKRAAVRCSDEQG